MNFQVALVISAITRIRSQRFLYRALRVVLRHGLEEGVCLAQILKRSGFRPRGAVHRVRLLLHIPSELL
jgi:hypothetical protein